MDSQRSGVDAEPSRRTERTPPIEIEPPVDLRELRAFLAVAEELNFTRAAARVHLTQQRLSNVVRELEDRLGVRLFDRSTRHVSLTDAGEVLVPAARRILAEVEEALDEVGQVAAGRRGHLAIGTAIAVHGAPVVRDALRRFADEAPEVDLEITGYDHSDPTAGLASGASDVAFVLGPLAEEGLSSITLLTEPRHVMLPADHPLARRREVRARDLAGLPWLRSPAPEGDWTRFWFSHPLGEPSTAPEVRTGAEWVPLIEAGRGVAYTLPTLAAGYLPERIVTVPVVDVAPGSVLLAWRIGRDEPLVEALVACARRLVSRRMRR